MAVELHLAHCVSCRRLAEALRPTERSPMKLLSTLTHLRCRVIVAIIPSGARIEFDRVSAPPRKPWCRFKYRCAATSACILPVCGSRERSPSSCWESLSAPPGPRSPNQRGTRPIRARLRWPVGEAITHRLSYNSKHACSNEWSCRLSAASATAIASCRSPMILAFRCTWPAQPQNSRASVARSATLPAKVISPSRPGTRSSKAARSATRTTPVRTQRTAALRFQHSARN